MPVTGGPNNPSDFPFRARKVAAWTTLDLIASYTFNLPSPAPAGGVPGFAKDGGKNVKMKDGVEEDLHDSLYSCVQPMWMARLVK